jgi:hypothetical protein
MHGEISEADKILDESLKRRDYSIELTLWRIILNGT